MIFTS